MEITQLHPWNLEIPAAIELQHELAQRLTLVRADRQPLTTIAGVDVSMSKHSPRFTAAVVVWRTDTGDVVEKVSAQTTGKFPYVPGLLSFREIPAIVAALKKVKSHIHAILVDGHGTAHPRRLGIASHLGLLVAIPTIGVAKSRLTGKAETPAPEAGSRTKLLHKGEHIGYVVRTRNKTAPVFVSAGNHIDHESAVELVVRCTQGYRLPEPTRQAHLYANRDRVEASLMDF